MTDRDLASDPSTPPDQLIRLLETEPKRVLENPAFPLVLLEVPDLWARLSARARDLIALSTHCPDALLTWSLLQERGTLHLRHFWVNRALTAAQRRAAFERDSFAEWRWKSERPRVAELLTADELALLDRLDADPSAPADFALLRGLGGLGHLLSLRRDDCPAALLEHIVSDGAQRESLWALRHPNLDADLLARALRSKWREAALQNPNVPQSVLDAVAATPGWSAVAASSPALSTVWRERFLRDPARDVRCALASNPKLTLREQNVLATDPDVKVRDAFQHNRHRSRDVAFVPENVRAEIHAQWLAAPP